jgi:retron-type reverse transcriptase
LKIPDFDIKVLFDSINHNKAITHSFADILEWLNREGLQVVDTELEKMYERWKRLGVMKSLPVFDSN